MQPVVVIAFPLNVVGMTVFELIAMVIGYTAITLTLKFYPIPFSRRNYITNDALTVFTHCDSPFLPVFQCFREGA